MFKRAVSTLLVVFAYFLPVAPSPTSSLVPFTDGKDGYRFYIKWVDRGLKKSNPAIDILFHDASLSHLKTCLSQLAN
jgi:hypothetical protein